MYRILPHPIVHNYGGILQAFALQRSLLKKEVRTTILHFYPKTWSATFRTRGTFGRVKDTIKLVLITLFGCAYPFPQIFYPSKFRLFKMRFMRLWNLDLKRSRLNKLRVGAPFIVGSDQVWRCVYARNIESVPFFFLDFATREQRQRSIAYAASFGSDEWEGTPEETEECKRLIKDFKAISVREHSGVDICREVFGVEAVQMPDPTLLLEQEDYNHLIRNWRTKSTDTPFMAVYLLDETEEKTSLTHALSKEIGLYAQHLMSHPGAKRLMDRLPLSVPQWLRFVRDSECVLTDSFHGCVFAIIFNKPFICLGNENRGSARFDSLLDTFDLKERLVTNPSTEQLQQLIRTPINWKKVNYIRNAEKERAIAFLKDNLESR